MKPSEMNEVADAIRCFANAITPVGTDGARDDSGGFVKSLTEAVMGITSAGMSIAAAIDNLADSIDYMDGIRVDEAGFSNPTKGCQK